jgi:ABC-2 type transport system ATP-binding protein
MEFKKISMASEPVIKTDGLTKVFGRFTAVDHVNLELQRGEIYGFLGPNGAGKTTTLMMLLGSLAPTSGRIRIFGRELADDPFGIKRRIGVVIEAQSYYDEMTAWEYLMFFAKLYRAENAEKRARELLERVSLWQWRDVVIGGYSTGMQRKLAIVRALLQSPDLLLLDEPVASLDPYGIRQVRELLMEEHAAGRTILISSHILSEVERTTDRVGIIVRGKLLFEDTMDNLRRRVTGLRRIQIELVEPANGLAKELRTLPFVSNVEASGQQLTIVTHDDRDYRTDVARAIAGQGGIVQQMRNIEPTLEEAFITITEAEAQSWAGGAHGT